MDWTLILLLISLVAGAALGAVVTYFVYTQATNNQLKAQSITQARLEEEINALQTEKERVEQEKTDYYTQTVVLENKLKDQEKILPQLAKNILHDLSNQGTEQLEKANQSSLSRLINPLKEEIKRFEETTKKAYDATVQRHGALDNQLKHLVQQTQASQAVTKDLTEALRGQSKTLGDWGEVVLAGLLEDAGLHKNTNYSLQESFERDGRILRPDAVMYLPDGRCLVIDAKVTLLPFQSYLDSQNNADKTAQDAALKGFLNAIQTHINDLSRKDYSQVMQEKSVDYVVMFVPIEPAFMLAMQEKPELALNALEKKVVLVSPSTLMSVLGIVNTLWRQDSQQKNAQEIAKVGQTLYEKLAGHVENLLNVGKGLEKAQSAYDDAFRQLKTGPGNVIKRAEQLKALGVSPSKEIPIQSDDNSQKPIQISPTNTQTPEPPDPMNPTSPIKPPQLPLQGH